MAKAAAKTVPTAAGVAAFLATIAPARRTDCETLVRIMRDATQSDPVMWGSSIVGFGRYHYTYPSGREGDSALVSFSPRGKDLTVYLADGVEAHAAALAKLGSPACGKGCVHFRTLDGLNLAVLRRLITRSVENVRRQHGSPA